MVHLVNGRRLARLTQRSAPSTFVPVPAHVAEITQMKVEYEAPQIEDFGSIADHTYQTPGEGTKSSDTTFETDTFNEFSHPAAS